MVSPPPPPSYHNKIKTFNYTPPRSDIFLDLKNVKSTEVSVEKPSLVYDDLSSSESLARKIGQHSTHLKYKSLQGLKAFRTFLENYVKPKLIHFRLQLCCEVILSNLLLVLVSPIIFLWIFILLLVRQGVTFSLWWKYGDRFKLMDGSDAAWGVRKFAHDNCFTSFYIIEGECSIEKIRERIKTSLVDAKGSIEGEFKYEKMRARIVQKCGFYCWEKLSEFDITKHVVFLKEEDETHKEMDEKEVWSEMEKFVDHTLDDDLPQWKIYVVPNFKHKDISPGSKKYVIIWRTGHSIFDGISALQALQNYIADSPVKMTIDPVNPLFRFTWKIKLVVYAQMFIFGARSVIKSLMGEVNNCFHGPPLTGSKTVTWARPIRIESLKQIKNALDTSTSAVLMSSFGGALRNLALRKNLPIPKALVGGMTCALIPYPDSGPQNRFTVARCKLQVGLECARERLNCAEDSVNEFGSASEVQKNFHIIRFVGLNPVRVIEKVMWKLQATFLLSNVPGPSEKYTIFGGDKLQDLIAWNTIKGRTGIGICLLSYGGQVRATLLADAAVIPNRIDAEALANDFENEIMNLAKVCGIPEELVFEY